MTRPVRSLTVPTTRGDATVVAKLSEPGGRWAVHPKIGEENERFPIVSLTHVASGLKVPLMWCTDEAVVLSLADRLDAEVGDFAATYGVTLPEPTGSLIRRIRDEVMEAWEAGDEA